MTTQKITQSIFDVFVGVLIFILAAAVSTIGLTIKANQYKTDQTNQIKVTVYKKPIPVLASTKGIIQKVHVRPGQEVRRGDVLIYQRALKPKLLK
jgi:multidrug resistance efflux pump